MGQSSLYKYDSTKKTLDLDVVTGEFYETFKEEILCNSYKKTEEKKYFPDHSISLALS